MLSCIISGKDILNPFPLPGIEPEPQPWKGCILTIRLQRTEAPTRIRTGVTGFKVQCDDHYTIGAEDLVLFYLWSIYMSPAPSPAPHSTAPVHHVIEEKVGEVPFPPKTILDKFYYAFISPPVSQNLDAASITVTANHDWEYNNTIVMTSFSTTILFLLLRYNKNLKANKLASTISIFLCFVTIFFIVRSFYMSKYYQKQVSFYNEKNPDKYPNIVAKFQYTMQTAYMIDIIILIISLLLLMLVTHAVFFEKIIM